MASLDSLVLALIVRFSRRPSHISVQVFAGSSTYAFFVFANTASFSAGESSDPLSAMCWHLSVLFLSVESVVSTQGAGSGFSVAVAATTLSVVAWGQGGLVAVLRVGASSLGGFGKGKRIISGVVHI